jgi:polyphosphate kinase
MQPNATPTGTIAPAAAPAAGRSLFFNREISWLDFNHRVLELAQDTSWPLLERVKYLAIFSSNLDEFFMKRVGGLQRQRTGNVGDLSMDGLTVQEQLDLIRKHIEPMLAEHARVWQAELEPALAKEGVAIYTYANLGDDDRAAADDYFRKHVFPILTPLAVDPGHPFPFISNLSKSLGVMLEHPGRTEPSWVRIKVPENLPRWVPLPGRMNFVPLEQVIAGNLGLLFPGMKVIEWAMFRVTRNADIEMDADDAEDLLEMVEQELRARRLAKVVRLELPTNMSQAMRDFIVAGLEVTPSDVYASDGPIDMDDLFAIAALDLPNLRLKAWVSLVPPRLTGEDVDLFEVIRSGDLLVHHPYESFAASVERFVKAAVDDPRVLAIKMTLYRTSSDSTFVPNLIRAAEMGKQVAVLIEIKARFDEQRNLELAQRLEKAGVHVVYGLVGLKTHTKLTMVVRDEPEGLRTYCHIGTGNYNSRTASLYTDLGLFTCNVAIADDVIDLFHFLTGRSLKRDYRKLLVAPVNMRDRFLSKIRREVEHAKAGRPARIVAKMNSLQDPKIITSLYEASHAGVTIDLIVRGFCCLRPKVPGMSENIRVYSILGRFLEHSRIFWFQNGAAASTDGTTSWAGSDEFFIGSADWMYRNLDYRVEAITPVEDPALRERLREILDIMLTDRGHAWELEPDGTWTRRATPDNRPASDTHELLMNRFLRTAKKVRQGR